MNKAFLSLLLLPARRAALVSLAVSVPVYIFLVILFHEFRLSYQQWGLFFLQLAGASWLLAWGPLLLVEWVAKPAPQRVPRSLIRV